MFYRWPSADLSLLCTTFNAICSCLLACLLCRCCYRGHISYSTCTASSRRCFFDGKEVTQISPHPKVYSLQPYQDIPSAKSKIQVRASENQQPGLGFFSFKCLSINVTTNSEINTSLHVKKLPEVESPVLSAEEGLQGHSAIYCVILEPLQDKWCGLEVKIVNRNILSYS